MKKILLLFLAASPFVAHGAETSNGANPIRKVVTLLQGMQKKIEAEGEKEEDLFKSFMCYCKTGAASLQQSIDDGGVAAPELEADINEATSKKIQLDEDLTSHRSDRQSAKGAIAEATGIREKTAKAFAGTKSEADSNIASLTGAITALEKGLGGFLQTAGAASLKRIVMTRQSLSEADRQDVLAFLSSSSDSDSPGTSQIVGLLKEMKDQMTKDLDGATSDENESIKGHEQLVAAKTKEINSLTGSIETKTQRTGDLAVKIVQTKNELSDTQAALLDNKKFIADLDNTCKTKASEWEVRTKTRSEELLALADTIKILNDDEALDLFGKTLPKPNAALLQLSDSTQQRRQRALALIAKVRKPGLDFISLALHGKQQGFEKVLKMIDEMVVNLKNEQVEDDNKKEYCGIQFDSSDDKKKALDRKKSDTEASMAETEDGLAQSRAKAKALAAGIAALDKSVAAATEQRQEENKAFTELVASNGAAKKLIGIAKNRMNKFYNPKLYKPPPARELTEEERIFQASGGTLDPTPAPGGIAGTGVTAFVQIREHRQAPAPPPATWDSYKQKGQESNGVLGMLDLLVSDLDKETTEAETDEENAQKEYEETMADASAKRKADSEAATDMNAEIANLEGQHQSLKETHKSTTAELMATEQYISSLHGECDWLVKFYDARKEARNGEIDSLGGAKAVLSGADYSFVQTSLRGSHRQ